MLYSRTDPESNITEYTSVYEDCDEKSGGCHEQFTPPPVDRPGTLGEDVLYAHAPLGGVRCLVSGVWCLVFGI